MLFCVRPGRKPLRPVFSRCGSFVFIFVSKSDCICDETQLQEVSTDTVLSLCIGKPTIFRFPSRSDTNRSVQSQEQARSSKFRIYEEEELYYPCSQNKGTDQLCSYCTAHLCSFCTADLCSYCTADLRFCFHI